MSEGITTNSEQTQDVSVRVATWRDTVLPKAEALAKSAEPLTIEGCLDGEKAGFEACRVKHQELVKARTGTDKFAKELKDEAQKVVSLVDSTKREIMAVTAAQEARLKMLLDDYKNKEEKARKESLAKRVDAMQAVGAKFDLSDLEAMSDQEFEKLHDTAKIDYLDRQEQERIDGERKDLTRKRIDVLRQKQGLDLYTGNLDDIWQVDEFAFSKLLASADERSSLRIQAEQVARDKADLNAKRQTALGGDGLAFAVAKGIDISHLSNLEEEKFAYLLGEWNSERNKKATQEALDKERKERIADLGETFPGYLGDKTEEEWQAILAGYEAARKAKHDEEVHNHILETLDAYKAIPFVPVEWLRVPALAARTPDELNAIILKAREAQLQASRDLEATERRRCSEANCAGINDVPEGYGKLSEAEWAAFMVNAKAEVARKAEIDRQEQMQKEAGRGDVLALIAHLEEYLHSLKPLPASSTDWVSVYGDSWLQGAADTAREAIDELKKEIA